LKSREEFFRFGLVCRARSSQQLFEPDCHCEEPEGPRSNLAQVQLYGPRLLRFARNDEDHIYTTNFRTGTLVGVVGFAEDASTLANAGVLWGRAANSIIARCAGVGGRALRETGPDRRENKTQHRKTR
jgi:hypothetical protein